MDSTSELPTEILHDILSCLPSKTAAQTSVLSKSWLKEWSMNPHLIFDEADFEDQHSQFCKFVDTTLLRYLNENLPISAFKLSLSFSLETDCDGLINNWVNIIESKRVLQLTLSVNHMDSFSQRYCLLANSVFSNMESLEQLELNQFRISLNQKASKDKIIQFRSLKSISLCHVFVSESLLHNLISCCPQMMTISLQYCTVPGNRIHISNLPNLLSFNILCSDITQVHIVNASKMLSFGYELEKKTTDVVLGYKAFLRSLNIGTCQNLRKVEFVNGGIDERDLFELIQTLPSFKELVLRDCRYLDNIRISSLTLEDCSIDGCHGLVKAIFDVPELLSLNLMKIHSLQHDLSVECRLRQCRISLDHNPGYEWTAQQFIDLRRSLLDLKNQVIDLTFPGYLFSKELNIETLKAISGIDHPTPQVENFVIYKTFSHNYSTMFDIIFWFCRPNILTIQECSNSFREYLGKDLLKKGWLRILFRWNTTWKDHLMNSQLIT